MKKTALLFDLPRPIVLIAVSYACICPDYARMMLAAADYAQINARLISTALQLTHQLI